MNIDLLHRSGNTAAKVTLEAGESITAEAGAMICMSGDLAITTTTQKKNSGSFLGGLKRLLGGESFFLNHFASSRPRSEVWLGTPLAGDMLVHHVDHGALIVQGGSYVASGPQVDIDL